jgi:hypothetical protein
MERELVRAHCRTLQLSYWGSSPNPKSAQPAAGVGVALRDLTIMSRTRH